MRLPYLQCPVNHIKKLRGNNMNPLMTIKGTIAVGFILALAIAFGMGNGMEGLKAAAMVWFHVLAGVIWIGLLYYFNFIQVPGVGKALAEKDSGGIGNWQVFQGQKKA